MRVSNLLAWLALERRGGDATAAAFLFLSLSFVRAIIQIGNQNNQDDILSNEAGHSCCLIRNRRPVFHGRPPSMTNVEHTVLRNEDGVVVWKCCEPGCKFEVVCLRYAIRGHLKRIHGKTPEKIDEIVCSCYILTMVYSSGETDSRAVGASD